MVGTKEELSGLFDSKPKPENVASVFIDQIVSEQILHQYRDDKVLEVAYEKGCLISRCLHHPRRYRANGIWLEPRQELSEKLEGYDHVSSNCCDLDNEKEIRAQYLAAYRRYRN
ncbi:MAG: hypothetical protein ABIA37_04145 [Candidatus Woesearchaeota archaeon]